MIAQKGFFEDLTEGKFSYPISHAIWTGSAHTTSIVDALRLKTDDAATKAFVAACLKECGSQAHTLEVVRGLDSQARSLMKAAPPNPVLAKLLDKLAEGIERCA